jgi:nicotinamide phosphoribosyltransferase
MADFQVSQATFRKPLHYDGDGEADNRIQMAGVMPMVLLALEDIIETVQDVRDAEEFYADFHAHFAPPYHKPYPFDRDMFLRLVDEYGGKIPVCVMALPDGQAHYVGEPHLQVFTDEPRMGEMVGWIESGIGPYLWAPSAVATRGRVRKDRFLRVFQKCYPKKTVPELLQMIAYLFHDFGRRGGAASQITGIAHLQNWQGTDTTDAAFAAVKYLNGGKKFGACSIMAAAHRTVTPWDKESNSIRHALEQFGDSLVAFVGDSYGWSQGVRKLARIGVKIIPVMGGWLVGRPDSGNPVECVLEGLEVFGSAFGYDVDESGLRVLRHSSIIQGDGVSDRTIFQAIYPAVIAHGWSPRNVAFGMGEYNHRAVRSDLEWALKTCMVRQNDRATGAFVRNRLVMKDSNSPFKRSFPGPVAVHTNAPELNQRVVPITVEQLLRGETGDLRVVYDGRKNPLPLNRWDFDSTRTRGWETWEALAGVTGDTVSPEIRRMQEEYLKQAAESAED